MWVHMKRPPLPCYRNKARGGGSTGGETPILGQGGVCGGAGDHVCHLAFRRQKQEEEKVCGRFEASLGHVINPHLKNKTKQKTKSWQEGSAYKGT